MKVPLCQPYVDQAELDAVAQVLQSGWYAHGPANHAFEAAFAERVGVEHAVSLNSCTAALHLAVAGQGITGEVLLPSFTWVASANAIVTAGARPRFVDVDYASRCIDPAAIEAAITPATEAIMAVHYGGQCADMTRIMAIAEKHGLAVIEDSAETIGATHQGRQAGSFAAGCFSFFPTKNITTGEGGMLTTNRSELADYARAVASHGIRKSTYERDQEVAAKRPAWHKEATYAGYNFRMSNLLAALGVEQLKKLDLMNQLRHNFAMWYDEAFRDMTEVVPPECSERNTHVYQMYTITVPAKQRDALVAHLNGHEIGAGVHFYPPVHRQAVYVEEHGGADLPVTEKLAAEILTLPMYPGMTQPQVQHVIEQVQAFFA